MRRVSRGTRRRAVAVARGASCGAAALRVATVILVAIGFAAELSAAEAFSGPLYICDSTDDRVVVLRDTDGSGTIELNVDEVAVFYDDSSAGPDLSTPSHLLTDEAGRLYLLDGGTLDAIFVLEDLDGDGKASEEGELSVFYSGEEGEHALGTPNTIAWGPDGSMFVADDGSRARRILKLTDLNRDGDALDAGEAVVVYEAVEGSVPLFGDIESLAYDGASSLYVGDSTEGVVGRLSDTNGDGDFLDPGEAELFFAQPENPLSDVDAIAFVDGEVYVTDEDSGLILRLRDVDGDGQVAGTLEVVVFVDHTAAIRIQDTNDFIVLESGKLLVLDGKEDGVFLVQDLNGDGDALDDGEIVALLADDGELLSTPSGLALGGGAPGGGSESFLRGDTTADGRLDLSDPVSFLNYLFVGGTVANCDDALDADDDGAHQITDAVYVLNFLFAGGAMPPAPFPDPGVDPTADELNCALSAE